MPSIDATTLLRDEIAAARQDRESHLAQARDLIAQAREHEQQAQSKAVLIEGFERVLAKLAPDEKDALIDDLVAQASIPESSGAQRSESGTEPRKRQRLGFPIRATAREFFQSKPFFSRDEYIAYVKDKYPEANRHSIRSELSFANTRGEISANGDGTFTSKVYSAVNGDGRMNLGLGVDEDT